MGQVPYGVVGDGRVARHFTHYLSLLKIPFRQWSRSTQLNCADVLASCPIVLLLINDSVINDFIKSHSFLKEKCCVHFSGSLVTDFAYGAHPLMTFGTELYTLEEYKEIPWILEDSSPPFENLLPGLPNPHFVINKEKKGYYHALCVMSNNFTTLLWQKFFNTLEQEFQIPKQHLIPILQRSLKNIEKDHEAALTGPLKRGDRETIKKNLEALSDDAFYSIYQSFVTAYQKENTR